MLMVSGIGPEETLKQHKIPVVAALPGVGQNMWVSFGREFTLLFPVLTRNLGSHSLWPFIPSISNNAFLALQPTQSSNPSSSIHGEPN